MVGCEHNDNVGVERASQDVRAHAADDTSVVWEVTIPRPRVIALSSSW